MAIKKFASLNEALAAGYSIVLGGGEYAEGGETVSRERYQAIFEKLKSAPSANDITTLPPT